MNYIENAKRMRPLIEEAAQSLGDADALTAISLFPKWDSLVKAGTEVEKGFRFQHDGRLWRTEQPEYTFVAHYVPGAVGTESIFSHIDEGHTGTREDPIPYEKNMEIYEGMYYTQNGVTYLCTRSSGQPLQHDLAVLVGHYVEVIT